jgi:hypothetical protein
MRAVKLVVVLSALATGAVGCSGNSSTPSNAPAPAAAPAAPAPQQEVITNNSIVSQISHPDEAMKALGSVAKATDWKGVVDASTAVSGSDKLKVSAAIGMQAANGVAAEYAGDDADAQKLATSVKGLADRLSLKSSALESLVSKTTSDFKEPDADKRSALVRTDLAQMQDELKATLDQLGQGADATMMVFGAWVEGVRMTSSVLKNSYNAAASGVLNRRSEADYFLAAFVAMPKNANPLYAQIVPTLTRLRDAMVASPSHQISAQAVGTIQSAASELAGLLRK